MKAAHYISHNILIICSILLGHIAFSANKTFTGPGNFSNASLWNAGSLPAAGDNLIIRGACTFDNGANNFAYGNLSLGSGGTAGTMDWPVGGTNTLNVVNISSAVAGGSIGMTNGGTLQVRGTWSSTNLAFTSGTGTVTIASTLTLPAAYSTYNNLTINGGGITATLGTSTICNGNLNITSGTLSTSGSNFSLTVNGNITTGGTLTANGSNISLKGNWTLTGTFNANTSTVIFNSSSAGQSISNTTTFNNLTCSNSSTGVTFGAAVTVNSAFTISTGTVTTGTFNFSAGAASTTSISGTLNITSTTGTKTFQNITVNPSGTWNCSVAEAITVNGNIQNDGIFTSNTGTYTLAGAGKIISGINPISINNATVTGTYTNNGIFTVPTALSGAGSLTQGISSTLNLGGTTTITTLNATTNAPNLVKYNGGTQTTRATNYYNLEIAATGTVTFGGNTTINNNFTVTSGTAAIGAFTTSVAGTTNISGTLQITSTTGTKTYNNVIINSGGTWTSSAAETSTINGSLTMSGGTITGTATGIYNVSGTFNITGGTTNTIGVGTLAITGTTTVDGTINFTSTTGTKTFSNIVLNSGAAWNSSVAETYTVNNNITMSDATITGTSAGIFNVAGNFITSPATVNTFGVGTMTVTGTTTNGGSLDFSSTTGTKTFMGKITNGGTWTSSGNEAFTIQGGITNNGIFTGGSGTYTFNTNSQVLDGTTAMTFGGNLAVSGAVTITNQNAVGVTVTGNLTGSAGASTWLNDVNSILNAGGSLLTTGTLIATAVPNTVKYNGGGAQTIKGTTYYNLNVNKTAGTGTFGSSTVNNNFTIASGTAAIGAVTVSVAGTTDISGTLNITSTTGTKTFQDVVVNATGVWNVTVAEAITINGSVQNDGSFTSNTGTYTLAGAVKTLSGLNTLTISNASVTGSYTNNGTFEASTSLTGAGSLTQGNNSTLKLGGTFTVTTVDVSTNTPNVVEYNGTGAQTIRAINYYNLVSSSTGSRTLASAGTIGIANSFLPGINSYTITGSTIDFNGTGLQTIPSFNYNNLTSSSTGNRILDAVGTIGIAGIFTTGTNSYTTTGSTVSFNGAGAQSIPVVPSSDYENLTTAGSGTKSLSGTTILRGTLTISAGTTFNVNSQVFTLWSDATGTARIADLSGGGVFSGNVIMQRYIGGSEGYRMLGASTTNATVGNINDSLKTMGFPGSDVPSFFRSSIYFYDETTTGNSAYTYPKPTGLSDAITPSKGTLVYVYGQNVPGKISFSGPPNTGTVNFTGVTYTPTGPGDPVHDGYNLVSNPYPSQINWDAAGWTKTNVTPSIYIYDESIRDYVSWQTGVGGTGSNVIASSQSFWIQTTGAPTFSATEAVKTAAAATFYKTNGGNETNLPNLLTLKILDNNNKNNYYDEAFIRFTDKSSSKYDSYYDTQRWYSNISLIPYLATLSDDSIALTINALPELTKNYSVPMAVQVRKTGSYTISAANLSNFKQSTCIVLEDKKTGTKTDLQATGSYTCTIDTGKIDSSRFVIHFAPPAIVSATATTCKDKNNGIATVKGQANGPWTYQWKNSKGDIIKTTANTTSADTLTSIDAGIYTVEIKNTGTSYCNTVSEAVVINAPVISASAVPVPVSCNNSNDGEISIINTSSGGVEPYSYLWSNGSTTENISNLKAGSYSLTITDANNCSSSMNVTVTQSSPLVSVINKQESGCENSVTLSVTGGNEPYSFSWSTGNETNELTNLQAGTYTVTITDNNNCTTTDTVTILNSVSTVTASCVADKDTVYLLSGATVSFQNTSTGATSYFWNFGDDSSSVDANPIHTYAASDVYNITLIANNGNCADTIYYAITVLDSPLTVNNSNLIASENSVIYFTDKTLHVHCNMLKNSHLFISVYNLLGQEIYRNSNASKNISIDFQDRQQGIYLVKVQTENNVVTQKVRFNY